MTNTIVTTPVSKSYSTGLEVRKFSFFPGIRSCSAGMQRQKTMITVPFKFHKMTNTIVMTTVSKSYSQGLSS